jgi:hypothetical protein
MEETYEMEILVDWVTRVLIIFIVICACAVDLIHNRKAPNKYPFKFIFFRFFFFVINMMI